MRAVVATRHGPPEVLRLVEDRPVPEPISTEVRVRVQAAGVNPVDAKTRRGEGVARWVGPPPFVPGWDVAGVVESTGYGVTRFRPGERVLGMPRFPREAGGYADYVTAPSRQLARVPDGMDDEEAAALPLAGLTAWQCLVDAARLAAGARLLVAGAGGGVGHLALQIGKVRGAEVVALCRQAAAERLRRLGADEVVEARDWPASGPLPVPQGTMDVVLDLVGGVATRALVAAVRPGGVLLAVATGADAEASARAADAGVDILEPLVEPDGAALEALCGLAAAGRLRVEVAGVLPLGDAIVAHRRIEAGGVPGKLVLRTDA
jgi:NADPH:quinone reductase-like Zn-dependent oxidoreductase